MTMLYELRRDNAQLPRTHVELDAWIVRRLLAGMHPKAIAAATDGAVSPRTVYRWKRDLRGVQEVQVGQHRATFALRDGRPPARISPWTLVPSTVRAARAMQGVRCGHWMPIAQARCDRFAGHRSQHNTRAHLDDAARVERERRAKARRALQRQEAA